MSRDRDVLDDEQLVRMHPNQDPLVAGLDPFSIAQLGDRPVQVLRARRVADDVLHDDANAQRSRASGAVGHRGPPRSV